MQNKGLTDDCFQKFDASLLSPRALTLCMHGDGGAPSKQ